MTQKNILGWMLILILVIGFGYFLFASGGIFMLLFVYGGAAIGVPFYLFIVDLIVDTGHNCTVSEHNKKVLKNRKKKHHTLDLTLMVYDMMLFTNVGKDLTAEERVEHRRLSEEHCKKQRLKN